MSSCNYIFVKLQQFIKKFYINELIKGVLLFISTGLLYFIFTVFIEYFLWLKPLSRTILFWLFIVVEVGLVTFYIFLPLLKIIGLKKGIDSKTASKIIGNHFPEVSDKLLNMLQLKEANLNSELIEASIEQKSAELQPIPFKKAIEYSKNKKFIKYTSIPVIILLIVYASGNLSIFNESVSRVVHYNSQYEAPAPFSFSVSNKSLRVVEGKPFTLNIETFGSSYPDDVKIIFNGENYYLENIGNGKFRYTFSSVIKPFEFYLESVDVVSRTYRVDVISTPIINNLKMVLNYPFYTGKKNEVIMDTGNAIVPEGTKVSWQIDTHQTDTVRFSVGEKTDFFARSTSDYFNISKKLKNSLDYKISTSNRHLVNYESLDFSINVVLDEYPKIVVKSNMDSIERGPVYFSGQISDDYGISKLQLVYLNKSDSKLLKKDILNNVKSSISVFYSVFPNEIVLDEGVNYDVYFEVYDNDAVNGSKRSKSEIFQYYKQTKQELEKELLKDQKKIFENLDKTLEKSKKANAVIEQLKNSVQKKSEIDWNDTKKLEQFIKRQGQYQEIFKRQTEKLERNLEEQPDSEKLKDKKKDLEKRIEETKKLANQERMLEELKKLSEKLDKEKLFDKLNELAKKNKQNDQSLERILELTKRFYVEQKMNQINEKLKDLGKKEESLFKGSDEENTKEKQEKINKSFDEIQDDFEELDKQNNDLKRPMKLPETKEEEKEIDQDLKNALDELNKQDKNKAKKNQKSAAKKMKDLAKSMEQSMSAMEGESIDEDIDDLRKIVENLIEFSFQQEELMEQIYDGNEKQFEYAKNIKKQYLLKEYFEHIDDSLYMLSLRVVKMGAKIQKEVSDAHFYIDKSLVNFTENRFDQGIANQQFVITAANNLANSLSNLLDNLMNASPSFGKGKGKGKGFSLPDIIKKQGEIMKSMKEGKKKGEAPGQLGKDGEGMNGELYNIYKEQAKLRDMLNKLLGDKRNEKSNGSGKVTKEMEDLEKEMLEKGFTKEVIEKMENLNYELLKLEKALKEQGEDDKRESESNIKEFEIKRIEELKLKNQYFNYNEILNRQSLPLRSIYKKKVQEYFKTN